MSEQLLHPQSLFPKMSSSVTASLLGMFSCLPARKQHHSQHCTTKSSVSSGFSLWDCVWFAIWLSLHLSPAQLFSLFSPLHYPAGSTLLLAKDKDEIPAWSHWGDPSRCLCPRTVLAAPNLLVLANLIPVGAASPASSLTKEVPYRNLPAHPCKPPL